MLLPMVFLPSNLRSYKATSDTNETCNKGLTFLQYAIYFNKLPAIDLLLQKGADRKISPKHDYTMDGISILTGSTAYDIVLRLHRNETAAKLRA